MYHNPAHRVAATAQYHGAFRDAVRRAALAAMQSPACSPSDSQLCRDLRRDDARYQFRSVDRVMDLLAALPDESPALAFIADIRGPVMARRQRNAERDMLTDALQEHALQCVADPLQLAVATDPRPDVALVRRALDATTRHLSAGERLRDGLYRLAFDLVHGAR